ncbi:hypothetical protein ACROYT_G011799 [Oculina patagonica]
MNLRWCTVISRRFSSKSNKNRQFIDWKKVILKAGNGGDGSVHFRRQKFQPRAGPDGGDGGRGGSVVLIADNSVKEFAHLPKHIKAEDGGDGRADDCKGKNGSDCPYQVPLGTVVKAGGHVIADITAEGQTFVAAQGGLGGLGNAYFKTALDRAPNISTEGAPGEEKVVELELKTIADIGLVGFPNAGKSTLLRAISRAMPAVAAYPFTTINPHVGIVEFEDYLQIAVADIPGLITGAHLNKGLGHAFLRHIERCRCLLYVLDISQMDSLTTFASLQQELELYKDQLSQRPAAIVANKIDIVESDIEIQRLENTFSLPVIPVSAKYGRGIPELKKKLRKMFNDAVVIS